MRSGRDAGSTAVAFGIIVVAALLLAGLGEAPNHRSYSVILTTATPLPTVDPTPYGEPVVVGIPLPELTPAAITIGPSNALQLAEVIRLGEPSTAVSSEAAFTRDGRWLVADWGNITVWQMPQGIVAHTLPLSRTSWGPLEVSPDGEYVAVGNHAELGWVELWNIRTEELTRQHRGGQQVRALGFNALGTLLAAGRDDSSVTVWDVETGYLLHELQKYEPSTCSGIAFHPERDEIAASALGNTVRIWDARNGLVLDELSLPDPPPGCELSSLAFSPDGQMLAAAMFWDQSIALWEGTEFIAELAHTDGGTIWKIAWSPDGKLITAVENAGPQGQQLVLWDVQQLRVAAVLDSWRSVGTLSPDGAMLVTYQSVNLVGSLWGLEIPVHRTSLPLILGTRP